MTISVTALASTEHCKNLLQRRVRVRVRGSVRVRVKGRVRVSSVSVSVRLRLRLRLRLRVRLEGGEGLISTLTCMHDRVVRHVV